MRAVSLAAFTKTLYTRADRLQVKTGQLYTPFTKRVTRSRLCYSLRMSSSVTRTRPNALADLRKAMHDLTRYTIEAGWSPEMGASPESVKKAAINTFGAPAANIPARDVMTPLFDGLDGVIRAQHVDALTAIYQGQSPVPTLDRLAEIVEAKLKADIEGFTTPPNAPPTIAHKDGRDDPLVDTGQMRDEAAARVVYR